MSEIPISAIHFFSQLVYLDTVPAMTTDKIVTVEKIAEYYLNHPIGKLYLKNRFGNIPKEYDLWLDMLENEAVKWKDWYVTDILDDNKPRQSGFYGCSYLSADAMRIVSFRGSELLGNRYYENDYFTDFGLAWMLKTPQHARVDDYWARFGLNIEGDFALTGHSLGGNLACYGVIAAPQEIKKRISVCAAFNAPGFNREFIHKNKGNIAESADRIRLIQNQYDLVSSMLENVANPEIIQSGFIPSEIEKPSIGDIFYPHSNFMYKKDADGGFMLSAENEKCSLAKMIHMNTDMLLLLPVKTRKELSEIILAALYAAPLPQNAGRYMLDAAIKYISHHKELLGLNNGEYGELVYSAGLLAELKDIPGLYKAVLPAAAAGTLRMNSAKSLVILFSILAAISRRK